MYRLQPLRRIVCQCLQIASYIHHRIYRRRNWINHAIEIDSCNSYGTYVVVFDCDLSPSQLRNVENQLGIEVFDRTGVIIEIFSRHARTKTAKLQVEIARLNYVAPRLRDL